MRLINYNLKKLWWLIISFVLVVIDQVSKIYVHNNMVLGEKHKVINNFLYITYARNSGAAWGIFSDHTIYLTIFSGIATLLLIGFIVTSKRGLASFSFTLIIAGAIGNLIDRIRLGYVIDFIDTYIFGYDFPVFNVADMAVTVGVTFLIIYVLFIHREMQV